MIYLLTDYSINSPYVGLLKSTIARTELQQPVIDLCHDLPVFNAKASAYLIAALCKDLPVGSVVVAVVDPGVGSARLPLWVEVDGIHFIGPDNGLFFKIVQTGQHVRVHELLFDPKRVSSSFHGRDIFVPAAVEILFHKKPESQQFDTHSIIGMDWPLQIFEVIYIDSFGNAMTGLNADCCRENMVVEIVSREIVHARTFSEAPSSGLFWYENSIGLIELARQQGSIASELELQVGTRFSFY